MTNISKTITSCGPKDNSHKISVVFFGSGPVAAKSLEFLNNNFDIEVVITKSVPSHHKGLAPVEEYSKKNNLALIYANNKNDLDELFAEKEFTSSVGVLVDYGVIVSEQVIGSFRLGIVNSHFSILPQWRGADPITSSILSGQEKTGVSLMLIEPTLDTGKLITKKSLNIRPTDTTASLTERLIELSNELLVCYLPRYFNGEIKPKKQPHPIRATYSNKVAKSDGSIDWIKPSYQLEREVRAYIGWPGSYTTIDNNRIIIKSATTTSAPTDLLDIKCGDGVYLSIDKVIAPSGRTMSAQEYINGYLSK